jgi:hypothetical protein
VDKRLCKPKYYVNFKAVKINKHVNNSIQIVALQEKKNGQIHLTQRAQRYHKGHKEFPLQILRILCVKNFGVQKPHFHLITINKTTSVEQ